MNEGESRNRGNQFTKADGLTIAAFVGSMALAVLGGMELGRLERENLDNLCGGAARQNCATRQSFACTGGSPYAPATICGYIVSLETKTPTPVLEVTPTPTNVGGK